MAIIYILNFRVQKSECVSYPLDDSVCYTSLSEQSKEKATGCQRFQEALAVFPFLQLPSEISEWRNQASQWVLEWIQGGACQGSQFEAGLLYAGY